MSATAATPWPMLPGWRPPGPDRLTVFQPADEVGRWVLDFHTPRGIVPLAFGLLDDLIAGAAAAAADLGLASGLQGRVAGCHVYMGIVARPGPAHPAALADGATLASYARGFRDHWRGLAAELTGELDALDAVGLRDLQDAALHRHWRRARASHARAWRVHFEVMYRVMSLHEGYLAVCADHGIDEVTATRMVEGERSVIGEGDAALRRLATLAEAGGFARLLLRSPTTRVLGELRGLPEAGPFVKELGRVLATYGRRTSSLFDLESDAWAEDPTAVLALVRSALVAGPPKAAWGGEDARALAEATIARLRAAGGDVRRAWELAVAANASWWNEEHNHVIDLRAHLPVRDVAREAARRRGLAVEALLHLLEDEFDALLAGRLAWEELAPLAERRAAFTESDRGRRRDLPAVIGTGEHVPDDVVFRQIMGSGAAVVDHIGDAVLRGRGVSPGIGRGTVRVVRHPEEIVLLRHGDVLVCEATSPSWTPAFDRIAAAVCDSGGLLTHAAIISREYGVPCVCATLTGTALLRDGDVVEVDGTAGTVRLVRRARRA